MNYSIRELRQDEIKDTFLYEAILFQEGVSAPPKDIIKQPELQVYEKIFGEDKRRLMLGCNKSKMKLLVQYGFVSWMIMDILDDETHRSQFQFWKSIESMVLELS